MRDRWAIMGLSSVLLFGATASAQSEPEHQTEQVTLEDDAARSLYEVATVHYGSGRLVDAAHEFEEAYRLSSRPLLLYNAYVAYRDANMRTDAARTLRAYLDSGAEDPRRTNLEARLAALEAELEAAHEEGTSTSSDDDADAPDASAPTPPPARAPSRDLASYVAPVLMGVGGAALIAAAITGGLALSQRDALASACPGGTCDGSRQGDIDTLATLALATDVVGGIGIAALVAGAVVLAVDLSDDGETSRVALGCGAGGCTLRGSF